MAAIPIPNLTVLDECQISPPADTVGCRRLPLTFFDIFWIPFPPINHVLFYEFPHPTPHFLEKVVPSLKHSLSLTLKHFFSFAGNLIVFPTGEKPEIRYVEGDSVPVTFAECKDFDFHELIGNHQRSCDIFYPLVPKLGAVARMHDSVKVPLFSVKVTVFPNSGISIGTTNNHVLGDASARFAFLKAWTSMARLGTIDTFPCYERTITGTESLDEIFMRKLKKAEAYNQTPDRDLASKDSVDQLYPKKAITEEDDPSSGKVRATFVLKRATINELKKKIATRVPDVEYVSSFTVVCGYLWSCMAKSREEEEGGGEKGKPELEMFGVGVDCRARLNPPLPPTYVGNCILLCGTLGKTVALREDEGFVTAAKLIGESIHNLVNNKDGILKDAAWFLDLDHGSISGYMGVSGTPKLKFYDLDFGWGKPKKYETISIDNERESISMNACRDSPGDFEIGVSLPVEKMKAFASIFDSGLETLLP